MHTDATHIRCHVMKWEKVFQSFKGKGLTSIVVINWSWWSVVIAFNFGRTDVG